MKIVDLKKAKQVIIFGFGREGRVTWSVLHDKIENLIVTDEEIIDHEGYEAPEKAFAEVSDEYIIIRTPGIPFKNKWLAKSEAAGATITSATEIFISEVKAKHELIGITGTKGKSTTASLLHYVLSKAGKNTELVGNIGKPMLKYIDVKKPTIFVLELSSYQLEDLTIGVDIGVVLNLFPEHMQHHGTIENYYIAKEKMLLADKLFVHPNLIERFSTAQVFDDSERIQDHLSLLGEHNIQNARAVLTVARFLDVDDSVTFKAFENFQPLPHRLQSLGKVQGIEFVDDSISTTPESTIAAINVYGNKLGYIILGGLDRGYDFSILAEMLKNMPDVQVYVMPGGERIRHMLKANDVHFSSVQNFDEVIKDVFERGNDSKVCLLSPASPSYNQFKNFEERGDEFKKAILSAQRKI